VYQQSNLVYRTKATDKTFGIGKWSNENDTQLTFFFFFGRPWQISKPSLADRRRSMKLRKPNTLSSKGSFWMLTNQENGTRTTEHLLALLGVSID
jgi:hypothetical protein